MQISYNWLKNYVPEFEIPNLENFNYKLDTRLSEVDKVEPRGVGLSHLVIAQIMEVEPHPTNKHLHVCRVDAGEDAPRTIVCGAENAVKGLKTVCCLPGGHVYDPKHHDQIVDIGERKMGEIMSAGMLCSPAELGLGTEHNGIIELPENSQIGKPVAELFRDVIIEIENKNLAHRADAFSHLGIARELSAIFKTRFDQRIPTLPAASAEDDRKYKISLQDSDLCKRYTAISITGIKIAPSPLWLQIAVSYAGLRPINNIVDITNYVMLDVGQPLHAFDADKLASNEVIIRKSKPNEQITTLDGLVRKLPTGTLVIADTKHPIAIAGIMGGDHTAISDNTTNIFLESANFEMYGIRRSSRALGLRTDASSRFEKGIGPGSTTLGLTKAVQMILDVCGGEVCCDMIDVYPEPEQPNIVVFNLNAVKRLQGIELDKSKLVEILSSVNLEIENPERVSADALVRADLTTEVDILIPEYRRDIHAQEDILEEIARLYGYENIPHTLPKRDLEAPLRNRKTDRMVAMKKVMAASGLNEVYTYTMVGEQLYKDALTSSDNLLKVVSPISPELSLIRDQVMPSLLAKVKQNLNRYSSFGLFEVSRVALKHKQPDGLPDQPYHLAGLYIGANEVDTYRYLRQAIDSLNNDVCGGRLHIVQNGRRGDTPGYMHPGKYANIELDNEVIGSIGILHPLVKNNLDISGSHIAVLEIELTDILNLESKVEPFHTLSNYQPVVRDLSFWQGNNTKLGELLDTVKSGKITNLDSVDVLDIFQAKDKKISFTLRVTLQSTDHTLTQAEITEAIDKITSTAKKHGHEVR